MARRPTSGRNDGPLLHAGDRLTQAEFHRLYNQMPECYRLELVGGVVFEPPPAGLDHSDIQSFLNGAFLSYAGRTPGLQMGADATVILSNEDEIQPDIFLRILPQYGGQSGNTVEKRIGSRQFGTRYIKGAPELLAEVSHTTKTIDLHRKKERYLFGGVLEYAVVCLDPHKIFWFDLKNHIQLKASKDSIWRSVFFPGLWINGKAVFEGNYQLLMDTIDAGMATVEYAQFRESLAKRLGSATQ
ncbi:MAG TPA: Uma2 family endonuclease [Candidatus Obscuribacterales bacterium]